MLHFSDGSQIENHKHHQNRINIVAISKFSPTIGFSRFWVKVLDFGSNLVVLMNSLMVYSASLNG